MGTRRGKGSITGSPSARPLQWVVCPSSTFAATRSVSAAAACSANPTTFTSSPRRSSRSSFGRRMLAVTNSLTAPATTSPSGRVRASESGRRCRESVLDYAKRVAACDDTDVLAVAVARRSFEHSGGVRRHAVAAADALANQPGATPPAGGVADDRPTEPALRTAVMTLMEHTNGAG